MNKTKILSLCDGMATGHLAFQELDVDFEYWAVEKAKSARALADANVPGIIRPCNDVLEITPRNMFYDWPVFDYIIFGFSCKSLSVQSNRDNLEGSSKILFDCMSVLAMAQYRNPRVKFLIENVASMENAMKKVITDIIGLDYIKINSSLVSGQSRERLYWCNWGNVQPRDRHISADSVLEDVGSTVQAWSRSTRYKDEAGKVHSSPAPGRTRYYEQRFRKDYKSNTLVTGKGCKGMSTKNIVALPGGEERDLSVRECARLQTIPDSFSFDAASINQGYEAVGNGWTLEVIKHLLRGSL